ncbi:MAG TPA: hypothetical protein VLE74_04360 [Candidatus Saccharimonadales bacterium]|nr:hypothetical protein [Candidatus Saccharimonadales bacterium]
MSLSLVQPPEGLVDNGEFKAAINSPDTHELVDSILASFVQKRLRQPGRPRSIVLVDKPTDKGLVAYHVPRSSHVPKEVLVATSAAFPNWLIAKGLGRENALAIAALYVDGFELVSHSLVNARSMPRSFTGSILSGVWTPEFSDHNVAKSVPYRSAARIAMEGSEGVSFEISVEPQPPHIAGLANPLSKPELQMALSVCQ